MGWTEVIMLALAAAGTAASASAAANAPDVPNYGEAKTAADRAEFQTLPGRRQLEMLARLGEEGDIQGYRQVPTGEPEQTFVRLPSEPIEPIRGRQLSLGRGVIPGELVPYVPEEWTGVGKYAHLGDPYAQQNLVYRGRKKEPERIPVDFTGMGDADIQAAMARTLAQGQLDLQRDLGPEFIKENLRQRELADPQGAEAYRLLSEEIQKDFEASQDTERPVAELLDRQISEEILRGKTMDDDAANAILDTVMARAGQGGNLDAGAIQNRLEIGNRGQTRLRDRQAKTLGYLGSGATPEDTEYRRRQQGISNQASFLRGETPVAQFAGLSGAQRGPAPTPYGPTLPNYSQANADAFTQQAATNFGYDTSNALRGADSWLAGLGLAIQGLGAYSSSRSK